MTDSNDQTTTPQSVTCPTATDPIIRRVIMVLICLGFGVYSIYELAAGHYQEPGQEATRMFTIGCAVILTPVGLFLLVTLFKMMTAKFEADQQGLGPAGKPKVAWSQVTKLIQRGKGLLNVEYNVDGEPGVLKLDSWKLQNFDQLVQLIDAKTEGVPVEKAQK